MSEQLLKTPCTFGENGNFLLERELGAGGMGGVYMGRDKMLDRPVAVKVMLKEYGADAEFVERFKKEAQAAAKLIHPNIAQIYSYGISDGMPYIAMELVAGGSLWTVMQAGQGKADVTRILKICQQVAQALQCSTDQGFVHGDIKPENILLDANGNAKLVDFGLAGMQKDTDEIWGTPYYIAPEKVQQTGIDFRADMYNLGGTLYHALTNQPPFEGADVNAVVKARFTETPKKPSEIRPELTPAVDALVMRMLEQDKEKRFPSFEALIEEFKKVLTSGLENKEEGISKKEEMSKDSATSSTSGTKTIKRTTIRAGRRMTTMHKRPSTISKAVEKPEDPDIDGQKDEDDEEEGGGNLGAKVVGAIVGGILLIGAVIGGLIWFQHASKVSEEKAFQQQIVNKIEQARESIVSNRVLAISFANRREAEAQEALSLCKTTTDELKKLLPDWANEMQPPPSDELLKAIASTNEVVAAPTPAAAPVATNAVPMSADMAKAVTSAAAQMGVAMQDITKALETAMAKEPETIVFAANQIAPQVGMPPPQKGFDPKSPEGQDYMTKLAAAVEKAKKEGKQLKFTPPKGAVAAPVPKTEEKKSEPEKPAEPAKPRPQILDEIAKLWDRAYSCQASAIRIRHQVRKLTKVCDKADEIKGMDRESMESLATIANNVKDMLDEIKASKDVKNIHDSRLYIKQKGEKTVENTVRNLRIEQQKAERKAKKEAEEAAEKAKHEAEAAAKQKLIEEESAAAKDKFEALVAQGVFVNLGWDDALRQLESLKKGMQSPEGESAVDHEIRKVEDMKKVQDIFKENLPGYVFKKSKLKGNTVRKVDASMIDTVKKDRKTPQKLSWKKFYKENHGNLNELINTFVVKGRENGKHRLNLRGWADAMCGAALTMRIICGDSTTAASYGETLVKQVYEAYPDYQKNIKAMFPDIAFGGEEAAAEGEEKTEGDKSEDKVEEKGQD